MKNVTWFIVLAAFLAGLAGNAWAFEGGTKAAAAMLHRPEYRVTTPGPAPVLTYDIWRSSKPVLQFLSRLPEATLSVERIRMEKAGPSTGTKAVVLFQQGW